MIVSFRHKGLRNFFETGSLRGIQPHHAPRLKNLLWALNTANAAEDMDQPGFNFHALGGLPKEMYDPPTLREFISEIYLKPNNFSIREFSEKLGVSRSTVNRLLNGQTRITPAMAERLSKVTGRSVASWIRLQELQDRWQERLRNAA